jgi:hypothetical protein
MSLLTGRVRRDVAAAILSRGGIQLINRNETERRIWPDRVFASRAIGISARIGALVQRQSRGGREIS